MPRSVAFSILLITLGWALWIVSSLTGIGLLAIASVIVTISGVVYSYRRDGWVTPIMMAAGFSAATTVFTLVWLWPQVGKQSWMFSYTFTVSTEQLLILSNEQLIFITSVFFGYLISRRIRVGQNRKVFNQLRPPRFVWALAYTIGIVAILGLYANSGGLGDILLRLNEKAARQSGNGWLMLLTFFGYAGAIIWYYRNKGLRPVFRYSGVILLCAGMLLTGQRAGVLVVLVTAAYIDMRSGKKITLKKILIATVVGAVAMSGYAMFRGGGGGDIALALFKDLSAQMGFIISTQSHILNNEFRPEALWQIMSPFIPSQLAWLKSSIPAANHYFTEMIYPQTSGWTASMGLFGESHYLMPSLFVIPYYMFIGVVLTLSGKWAKQLTPIFGGVFVGIAYRVARGGFIIGMSFGLELLIPLALIWFACRLAPVRNKTTLDSSRLTVHR